MVVSERDTYNTGLDINLNWLRDSMSLVSTTPSPSGYRRRRSRKKRKNNADSSGTASNSPNLNNPGGNSSPNTQQKNGQANMSPFFPCSQCMIHDNDPRIVYEGPWTLNATHSTTVHSTTHSGTISLNFNGSGIIVFGTVPASNITAPPPAAVYYLDDNPFPTTLPFAERNVPNQPLFASSGRLSNHPHRIIINVTSVAGTPYIFEKFFVFPGPGNDKDVIGKIPTSVDGLPMSTGGISSTTSSSTSAPSLQAVGPSSLHTAYNPQRTIKVLAGLLGTFVFLAIGAGVAYVVFRRRWRSNSKQNSLVVTGSVEKGRPETVYTSFTSTESILRPESIWSPFRSPRTPRSQYSRGHSNHSTSGRTSTIDYFNPPPLPPKPLFVQISPS